MNRTTLASELRAERARLVTRQRAIASTINSFYPRLPGPPSSSETAVRAAAEANTRRIREIDADLAT